jgi:ATP-binding cassette subfamily B protein
MSQATEQPRAAALGPVVRALTHNGRASFRMIPRNDRIALGCGLALMVAISLCNTEFPILQGQLLDGIQGDLQQQRTSHEIYRTAGIYLGLIAGVFLIRETLLVVRSYIVESACTRIEKAMTVTTFSHLLRMDLKALTHDKIGALQGRITRNVVGSFASFG